MGVLTRARMLPAQRYDLEDFLVDQNSLLTDAQYWHKRFLSSQNYIVKGFEVTGIGLKAATVLMTNATLINSESTTDFSWFTSEVGAPNIVIPDAQLQDGVKNYIELRLINENNTPATKAFWDPAANSGAGSEFNQETLTVTDLSIEVVVSIGGFSGDPDRIPVAIVDVNGSGNITGITDKRDLFFSVTEDYTWISQQSAETTLTLSSVTGVYVTGETLSFSGGATAICSQGGTTTIKARSFSSDSYTAGNSVTGGTSGATGTLVNYLQAFTGGDSDISDFRENDEAIKTEIKALKGTDFWYESGFGSISGVNRFQNSVITQLTELASFEWDGALLSITDRDLSPSPSDQLGQIELFGQTNVITLSRQDAGDTLAIADGQVLFVKLPASGNRSYADIGSGDTNFQVVTASSFVRNDTNYWLAFRQGDLLYIRNHGKLGIGDSVEIGAAAGGTGSGLIKVDYLNPLNTTLPTGSSVIIDGVAGINGDWVLFTNLSSGNNKIYELSGVGTSIVWTAQAEFEDNSEDPSKSDAVIVRSGIGFAQQIARFDGTNWKVNDTVRYFSGADYWEQSSLKTSAVAAATTANIFTVTLAGSENWVIDYSIVRGAAKETGTFYITSDGTTANSANYGTNIGSMGVLLFTDVSAGNLRFRYTSTAGAAAEIKYFSKRWSDAAGGPAGVPSYSGSGGGGSGAAGNITEIQYNGPGDTFAASSSFKWDDTNKYLQLGTLDIQALTAGTINDGQAAPATIINLNNTDYKFAVIEYSIIRNTGSRIGRMQVCHNGTVASLIDDSTDTGGAGISTGAIDFSATISGASLLIQYTSSATGFTGTFKYSVRKWV